jgi:tetratricopeptide (TPR) repeat protein
VTQLTPFLQSRGLAWEHLEKVLELRQQLFELDSRFGELRPQSIFHKLDSSGQLQHHVDGVGRIDRAMFEPPEGSRASLRGRVIQQLFPQREEYACDWQSIQHLNSGRYLDLSSPRAADESWQDHQVEPRPARRAAEILRRLRGTRAAGRLRRAEVQRLALTFYRQGSYKRAEEILESLPFSELPNESRRLLVWVRVRRGGQSDAEILRQLHPQSAAAPLWWVVDQIFVARFGHGLLPHPQMATWLQCGTDTMARTSDPNRLQVEVFREHQAAWLLHRQRLQAAHDVLEPVCRPWLGRQDGPVHVGRALCTLSEIYRRQADLPRARQLQNQAEQILRREEAHGDVAEFALTARARLQSGPDESLQALEEALHLQARQGNRGGQARSLLLLARLTRNRARRRSAKRQLQLLQQQCPALQDCPLLAQIIQTWRRWTHRQRTPDEHGNVFWGV